MSSQQNPLIISQRKSILEWRYSGCSTAEHLLTQTGMTVQFLNNGSIDFIKEGYTLFSVSEMIIISSDFYEFFSNMIIWICFAFHQIIVCKELVSFYDLFRGKFSRYSDEGFLIDNKDKRITITDTVINQNLVIQYGPFLEYVSHLERLDIMKNVHIEIRQRR